MSHIQQYFTAQPSALEVAVYQSAHMPMASMTAHREYASFMPVKTKIYNLDSYKASAPAPQYFTPESFLKHGRPVARFVGKTEDIKHYIQEAFEKTTGKELPEDIVISIVPKEELKEKHEDFNGAWSNGLQGFAINKKGFADSIIIVKENELDKLMLTIGHELGHVMSFSLPNRIEEEAKAFSFELAWMDAICSSNIAGLENSFNQNARPAENGLHDVAFNFVKKEVEKGKNPMQLFRELVKRELRLESD